MKPTRSCFERFRSLSTSSLVLAICSAAVLSWTGPALALTTNNCGTAWDSNISVCADLYDSDCGGSESCNNCGMANFWVSLPFCNVRLEDTPSYYSGPRAKIAFSLSYRQRGAVPERSEIFGVGKNWSCSFRSYLVDIGFVMRKLMNP